MLTWCGRTITDGQQNRCRAGVQQAALTGSHEPCDRHSRNFDRAAELAGRKHANATLRISLCHDREKDGVNQLVWSKLRVFG